MTSPSTISADVPQRSRSVVAAFGYAFAGLASAWRTQRNVRIHTTIAAGVVVVGALLRLPALAWALLAFAIALVIVAELLNTALEAVVDLISPEDHPLAKQAKDVAAAAVLVASVAAVVVAGLVLVWTIAR